MVRLPLVHGIRAWDSTTEGVRNDVIEPDENSSVESRGLSCLIPIPKITIEEPSVPISDAFGPPNKNHVRNHPGQGYNTTERASFDCPSFGVAPHTEQPLARAVVP